MERLYIRTLKLCIGIPNNLSSRKLLELLGLTDFHTKI
jgi:hypothetical protein